MQHELSVVADILDLEEERLFALEEIWRQAMEEMKERQIRHVPPHEIFMYHTYLHQISLEVEAQRKRVTEAQKRYHEKRESLITASQEKKIVKKVRDKDRGGIVREANRAEKKAIDEAAKNRYLRRDC